MADNTLQTGTDTIATDDIGGIKYQRVKATFGVDGVAVDVSSIDPLPVATEGLTELGTLTAAGSITIVDLRSAATVTIEGVATAMTAHSYTVEVLTAAGIWQAARWVYAAGVSGSIATPTILGLAGALGANSIRAIVDVAGYVGCRWRTSAFTGTSFAVTLVTSYAATTRIGPDFETATNKNVSLNAFGTATVATVTPGVSTPVTNAAGMAVGAIGSMPSTAEVASAARTANGNSGIISDIMGGALNGTLNVTAVSGTNPTLDLAMQESSDNGTTWVDVYHFERVGIVGVFTMPSIPINGRRRFTWALGGTASPTFTFSVSTNRGGFAQYPRLVQFFDRTAGLLSGTLNAVSAAYQVFGCRGITAAVTLAAATTPASFKLQGSIDGTNWYDMAAAVAGLANATVAITNTGNTSARFARVIVSVAGSAQTGSVVAITGAN